MSIYVFNINHMSGTSTTSHKQKARYLFLIGAVNPKASEVMNRSMGSPVPANAQAPKGQKFILALQSIKRPASRSICKKPN